MPADLPQITRLAAYCWNDVELERFAQRYRVDDLPAHVACDEDEVVGAASYARDEGTIRLVMLAVMPHWQGRGAAKALLDELIDEARAAGARRVVAATTNAGLPALQLYQRYGFAITGVLVGALVEPDGEATPGFGGIPVRDEIQLELRL
jgi:ribosomal protein S18 acetylase RimI-like enzyme